MDAAQRQNSSSKSNTGSRPSSKLLLSKTALGSLVPFFLLSQWNDASDVLELVGTRRRSEKQPNAVQPASRSTARGGTPCESDEGAVAAANLTRRLRRAPNSLGYLHLAAGSLGRHFWAEWPASAGPSGTLRAHPARGLQ